MTVPKPNARKPTAVVRNLYSTTAPRVWKNKDLTTRQKVDEIRRTGAHKDLVPYLPEAKRPQKSGSVLVFGTGDAGQLGLGEDVELRKFPAQNKTLNENNVKAVDVAAGGMHTVVLDDQGQLWSWGCNDQFALGRSSSEDEGYIPTKMQVEDEDVRFVKVVCADSMTIALSEDGTVYTCGTFRNSRGSLGFNPGTDVQKQLTILRALVGFVIVDIACGVDHVLALSNSGVIFQWGCGEQAQLGRRVLERHETQATIPRELWIPGAKVIGAGSFCSFAYTHDGTLYAWGLNNYSQTGIDPEDGGFEMEIVHPTKVRAMSQSNMSPVVQIHGGEHHTVALLENGEVWTWGRGDSGQLGIPMDQVRELNKKMAEERGENTEEISKHKLAVAWPQHVTTFTRPIRKIAAGGNHSLAVDDDAKVYSWGYGDSMQLGSGEEDDRPTPEPVGGKQLEDAGCLAVSGGASFRYTNYKSIGSS
ncbi:regulator of chromosome condensation 1/beta-lactamase-inhibitor protein II [Syncephalis plumigaleata]|nr:regulator of chromosome condensation 1/beta-lactamase-inhibitor protein II [Syncephalis plumigaleata]